jgi:hypothetical protein
MMWTNGPGFPGPFLFAAGRRLYQYLRQISPNGNLR